MTARPVLRGPGAETLRLIGYPAVREVLIDLARRSRRPSHIDREHEVASSTFHRHLPELLRIEAITRRVIPGPPRQVVYSLGPAGPEICELIDGWLALLRRTAGSGSADADWRAPIGFAEAWAAGLIQAHFDGPLSQDEIEMIVRSAQPGLTIHQVKRLLANNTAAGFLSKEGSRKDERYELAERGRYAVGELAASARVERLHMHAVAIPITAEDVANALRAHLPLLELPEDLEGICEFAIRPDPGQETPIAMAWAEITAGRVVAEGSGRPPRAAMSWAQGTIGEWIAAVMDHRPRSVQPAGERRLGQDVIDELHSLLYRRY